MVIALYYIEFAQMDLWLLAGSIFNLRLELHLSFSIILHLRCDKEVWHGVIIIQHHEITSYTFNDTVYLV